MSGPEAGWYPDPLERYDYRYWDGQGWTEHASSDGETFSDPLPGAGSSDARAAEAGHRATQRMTLERDDDPGAGSGDAGPGSGDAGPAWPESGAASDVDDREAGAAAPTGAGVDRPDDGPGRTATDAAAGAGPLPSPGSREDVGDTTRGGVGGADPRPAGPGSSPWGGGAHGAWGGGAPGAWQAPARYDDRELNAKAVAALVLGIGQFVFFFVPVLPAVAAIILATMARREIARSNERGASLALAALILGWLGLGFVLVGIFVFLGFVLAV